MNRQLIAAALCILVFSPYGLPALADELVPIPEDRETLACKPDVRSLCQGIPEGSDHIRACLRLHADAVSVPCRQALRKHVLLAQGGFRAKKMPPARCRTASVLLRLGLQRL
ncbi:hypothetical protein [Paludibacterium yongneupense]|uniref:hypothetical protein n=1 Tax=Paludibacterium yongneupense TaxID=400061 RepID=UPI00041FCC84|nr:hypothetical protein [Paludibacterium yongneupense]